MDSSVLLNQLRWGKERFAEVWDRFQESRAESAALRAASGRARRPRGAGVFGFDTLTRPIYTFDRASGGTIVMIGWPAIGGGSDAVSGAMPLRCWVETMADAMVVHVEGEVDLSTAPWLADSIAYAFRHGPAVIVDMAGVNYLDGSGIAVLKHAAESHLLHLAVAATKPRVRRLFEIVDVTDVIPLVSTLEAAREYLRQPA